MKTIFRYPGGKSKPAIRDWILSHRPSDTKEFRETMVGGGGVFFAISEGPRWINDKSEGLIEVYKALRDRPAEFIGACRAIAAAQPGDPLTERGKRGGRQKNARLFETYEAMAAGVGVDPALRYLFLNRTNFGGRVDYSRPYRFNLPNFSNQEGWNIVNGTLLEQAANHLQGVRITCDDYEPLLLEAGDSVWVYVDPPYVVNDNLTERDQLYAHNFNIDAHVRLRAIVGQSPHRVCISYDDDEGGIVRDLYKGFTLIENEWAYGGTILAEKKIGKELLILNY